MKGNLLSVEHLITSITDIHNPTNYYRIAILRSLFTGGNGKKGSFMHIKPVQLYLPTSRDHIMEATKK